MGRIHGEDACLQFRCPSERAAVTIEQVQALYAEVPLPRMQGLDGWLAHYAPTALSGAGVGTMTMRALRDPQRERNLLIWSAEAGSEDRVSNPNRAAIERDEPARASHVAQHHKLERLEAGDGLVRVRFQTGSRLSFV